MKARSLTSRPFLNLFLAALVLAVNANAQLPNAWQITDHTNTVGSSPAYTNQLPSGVQLAATNTGFDFSVNARIVTDYGLGSSTMVMIYGDGTKRWEILWSLTNGDLVSLLITNVSPVKGETFVVTSNGTGTSRYHSHEIIYNPASGRASYLVDGQVLTTNWTGSTASGWTAGEVAWGAGSSGGEGKMNFHSVSFIVTNGVVAGYDAGNSPAIAPNPVMQGWHLSPSTPPPGTSTNAILPDNLPGVVTTLADGGAGSLRQVMASINPGDYISFATNGVIKLTSGELLITKDLIIAGPGPANLAVDAGGNSRVLHIADSNNVALYSLTLTNGHTSGSGGGVLLNNGVAATLNYCNLSGNSANNGGGIGNESLSSMATLNYCILSGNSATNNGGGLDTYLGTNTLNNCTLSKNSAGYGGGIECYTATLVINNCTLSGNSANYLGGGINNVNGSMVALNSSMLSGNAASGAGGGIYNYAATVSITDSTLSGNSANGGGGIQNDAAGTVALYNSALFTNSAGYGGGIQNYQATNTLDNCTLSGNSATNTGGGLLNNAGTITVNNSILSSNSAVFNGGSIHSENGGTVTINGSVLSGNSAADGGAIENNNATLAVNNSTLSGNTAGANGGGSIIFSSTNSFNNCTFAGNSAAFNGGAIFSQNTDTLVTFNNSTLSGNSAGFAGGGIYNFSSPMALTNTIVAGNTATSDLNITGTFPGANNLTNGNPVLAPLGNYGGPTQTMPPLAGSPAIDSGLDSVTTSLPTDQRGYTRLSGAHVDIGAVESQLAPMNNRPQLKNLAVQAGGALSFNFTNMPNADFTVLASTNVAAPLNQWMLLGLTMQVSPGQYKFTDPGATNYPKRFYQVVSP